MAKVFIGIPMHAGTLHAATMRSINVALQSKQHKVSYQNLGLSLLARNFNTLWINAYLSGADFFVLHHSDLGVTALAGVSWIDALIDKMYLLNAAVISVASPIKSLAGHCSMGLDLKAGNPYTLRRVTVCELAQLPHSFIARIDLCKLFGRHPDTAGAFIINTGLMIMDLSRFDWSGMRWPGFDISDKIVWSLDSVPSARTIPEDWGFSRWMHDRNIPFFATRELILDHHGSNVFINQGHWGEAADSTPKETSIEEYEITVVNKVLDN